MDSNNPNLVQAPANEFYVEKLAISLWASRKLVVVAILASFVCIFLGSSYLSKSKSEGFLQFGGAIPLPPPKGPKEKEKELPFGINLADYKRYSAAFFSTGRFDDYILEKQLTGSDGVKGLRAAFAAPQGVSKSIEPIYVYTKLDAKDLMEQPKDSSNNVIGLRIRYEEKNPHTAQKMVELLGRYTMDTIVYLIYSDNLRFKHADLTSKLASLDNNIIDLRQKLAEFDRRGTTLKKIVARYPGSAVEAGRQLVSVTDETARFLSPITHLMSTEVESLEANESILAATRDQKQMRLQLEYYDQAKKILNASKSGEAVLLGLDVAKERVFKNKDLTDELVKEVYNSISIENRNAYTLYFEKSRFIAGPTLPDTRSNHLLLTLLFSLVAGLVVSVGVILCREWWGKGHATLNLR